MVKQNHYTMWREAVSRVGAGGGRFLFLQMLKSVAYGWDIHCPRREARQKILKKLSQDLGKSKKWKREVQELDLCQFVFM